MLNKMLQAAGIGALFTLLAGSAHANLLTNGTFETPDASGGDVPGTAGWTTFETVFTNATDGPGFGPVSHDVGGTQSLKMYGPFFPGGAMRFDGTSTPVPSRMREVFTAAAPIATKQSALSICVS